MNRRRFLVTVAALPALQNFCPRVTFAAESAHAAPYLALKPFIEPGHDEFAGEKRAAEITAALHTALALKQLPVAHGAKLASICPASYKNLATDLSEAVFTPADSADGWSQWIASLGVIRRAQFFPLPNDIVRFEVAAGNKYHTGLWKQTWSDRKLTSLSPLEQHTAVAAQPYFRDVTEAAFQRSPVFSEQFSRGVPYWRSRLDPATGIDIYGSNGIAVGDIDNDGQDEIYVCQPGGIPNRLLKFREDGTLTDISKQWNVHMLDDTSAALFLDLRNTGRQDLVVLRSGGPVLLINEGATFTVRTDAFHFLTAPQGGFTGMAAADYNRNGKLDLYLCCYVYFQSEAQYTYASPYHDARNGPPNFLLKNNLNPDGSGMFEDVTAAVGLNENNNRFSFAPAWCDFNDDGWPDLYVANDFGRKNFYVNKDGHFTDQAAKLGVDDIGPGMSASWFDYNHDGLPDLYVANMWTAAGQRVIHDPNFTPSKSPETREAYLAHTMGNSLFEQRAGGAFQDVSRREQVNFGRWAWAAGGHDLDNCGNPEIFVTCGMLTNESQTDLGSFFWRQVVAKSPLTAQPSISYQNGWNAINQFVREDYSWNGHEPNVLHVRRGTRYFDFSGVSGLDFASDSRSFALIDFDNDGRPDMILKSRLGPQVRILQNNCAQQNHSIAFRLRGTNSNRDAIGARIQVDRQTKWLTAGSEFLSQHSKRILFGLGNAQSAAKVTIKWPSGIIQHLENLAAGHTYSLVEGSSELQSQPFRTPKSLPASIPAHDNSLALADTWFLEPIPLPHPQHGPGLFQFDPTTAAPDKLEQFEIFRRYLFDWRTSLNGPLMLLLNESGHAVKIYAQAPTSAKVTEDLAELNTTALDRAVPFQGYYVGQRYRDFFKFGAAFLWAGYPAQSLPYLEQVLQHSPDNLRVLLLAAQVTEDLNPPKSIEFYNRALAVDANSAEANNGLGLVLAKSQSPDARKYFERAIDLRPNYSDAINNLGILYTKQGKMNDAIAAFQYGIQVAPDEDILYLNLGRAYIQTGKVDRARELMQQLLDRKPDNAIARRALQELNRQ